MREFLKTINHWSAEGKRVVLARVIKTWGSSPRPVGSVMLVNEDQNMVGSVSGGCVEGEIVKKSLQLMDNDSAQKMSFGVSDEEAWKVGLSCGGSLEVFLQVIDFNGILWKTLKDNLDSNKSSVLISSIEDGQNENTLITEDGEKVGADISNALEQLANETYNQRSSRVVSHDERDYFIQIFPRKELLIVIGAAHIAVDLVSFGNQFGFETVVIDPRGFFANNTVFKDPPSRTIEAYPSEVLNDFPLDAYTYCAILSHDPKIDDNALEVLLPSDVAYIGALGSRKNQAKRVQRMLDKGFSQDLIDKIDGPIGVAINARTAKEIALSIISKIIDVKNEYLYKR